MEKPIDLPEEQNVEGSQLARHPPAIWTTIGTLGARVIATKSLGLQIHSGKENAAICAMIKSSGIRMDTQKVMEKAG